MYEQGYAIGKIINTTQIASKEIQEMSTTMGAMGNNLHNAKKQIELYANKFHNVDQQIEVSSFYNFLLFSKMGSIQVKISVMLIIVLLCWKRNKYHTHHASNPLLLLEA